MATKNVPAVKKSTAVASYVDRMAALAKEATKIEESVSSGSFISFKGGRLSYQGNQIKGDELDVIVIDHVLENCYYPANFDADNPTPPICYAFGREDAEMAPHPNVKEPQASKCAECEWNKFGTSDNGKGKACKNTRRLAVIPADAAASTDKVMSAEAAFIKVPVTSVKGWASYVRALSAMDNIPPLGAITTVGVVPDSKSQFKATFQKAGLVDGDVIPAILDRHDAMTEEIMFPYPEASEEEAPKSKGRAAAKGRAPARKGKY